MSVPLARPVRTRQYVPMRVVVLGSVGVVGAVGTTPSGPIARRVLAVLAAEANRPVHPDRLADLVWSGGHRAGSNSLQAHISRLRTALGAHRVTYSPAGYTLIAGPEELDALEFEELVRAAATARRSHDLATGIDLAEQAAALWQGAPFASLADDACVRGRAVELETAYAALRLGLLEMRCETGDHERVVAEATGLVDAEPWNEPMHRVLARALYSRGDQVAALQVLTDLESALRTELGLDLGAASQLLREQVLRQEPALDLATPPSTVPDPAAPPATPLARMADRVAAFPVGTQQILHSAALSGLEMDTAHLGRALGVDGPTMADALSPALAAGVVVRTDEGIGFANEGVRDVVAGLVPAGHALELHRRLGETLLTHGGAIAAPKQRAADHLAAAAALAASTARQAVDLDGELAHQAMAQARYGDAVHHARRALVSAAHLSGEGDRADLHLVLGAALQRLGDLGAAMAAYRAAADAPGVAPAALRRCALAHEECSLHARRHRTGAQDPSINLLERALGTTAPDDAEHVVLLAALAQALSFAGLDQRAAELADAAAATARTTGDPELLARTLLHHVAVRDPVREAATRLALAEEAVEASHAAAADELEIEAMCALVPELMRAGRLAETEEVVAQVEQLVEVHDNVLHRCKVPMWRAALALAAGRYDEAEVLMEDFRQSGLRDRYDDTARIHGFQSILLALGRGDAERAAAVLDGFAEDAAFEPWRATALVVADARGDRAAVLEVLVPWSARRFTLSRPFAGVRTFCACLVAGAVARHGDAAARTRLADLVRPGVGQNQVLGAGAAMLGDAAEALQVLTEENAHG